MCGVCGAIAPATGGIAMTVWNENGLIVAMVVAIVAFLMLAFVRRVVTKS